jgi:acetylornithine deacetylase/succinyl-diaminopimelate desuccinylase-like protein
MRFPSVSAQPERAADLQRCAQWLAGFLRRIGLGRVRVVATNRHPYVLAQSRRVQGAPSVLLYGHYDVVPADPREWRTPPFTPTRRGEHLYGRGASDDKGPFIAHLKALEALLPTGLPVNVIVLCDGEEEIGSPNLRAFLEHHRQELKADVAVVSDTRMLGPHQPTIITGLRGSLSAELEVRGPPRELHSGTFGGAIHNPAQVLSEMLAGLHDANGRVRIPGFYANVSPVTAKARARAAQTAPCAASIYRDAGVSRGWGEAGFSAFERTTIRPSLSITGLNGGYAGPGNKSIIPASANAKLNLRLVPAQNPRQIAVALQRHIQRVTPQSVRSSLCVTACTRAVTVNTRHPAVRAARVALEHGFGRAPVLLRSGGSIPVVNLFQDILGLETVLMGFSLPDDGIHGPNERLHLPTFLRAIRTCKEFYQELGRNGPARSPQPRVSSRTQEVAT